MLQREKQEEREMEEKGAYIVARNQFHLRCQTAHY